jgi:hypothetical protein
MTPPSNTAQEHPDELLAGYVEGSSTVAERALVDAHLAACSQCREELDLATAARTALASLPELEPPGLGAGGLLQAEQDGPLERPDSVVLPLPERGGGRERRTAWVPALAAAAIVVIAGLLTVPILLRGGGGGNAAAPSKEFAQTPAASPIPALVDTGASYTPASLNSLAKELAPAAREKAAAAPGATPAAGTPTTGSDRSALSGAATDQAGQAMSQAAMDCLASGGGLSSSAVPLYLEAAKFKGVPAYVGAFFTTGARLNFSLVAVSRTGCQPLYTLTRPA